jgi:uncharacterized membrane protein (DUF373 family)
MPKRFAKNGVHIVPIERQENGSIVRLATALFRQVEHLVYIVLGMLLSAAALIVLVGSAVELWQGAGDWTGTTAIFSTIDRLLFVLLLIEILHTVRASIRTGSLTPEPFLIVGLIASIRRVLVITMQTSEASKPGGWTPDDQEILHYSMIELGVLGVLILILMLSLYLLRRSTRLYGVIPDEEH